jgi:hypothetical protein
LRVRLETLHCWRIHCVKSYETVRGSGYVLRAEQRADLIPAPTIALTTGYQVASSPASVSVGRVTARRASAGWASAANSSAPASATVPKPDSAIIGL